MARPERWSGCDSATTVLYLPRAHTGGAEG